MGSLNNTATTQAQTQDFGLVYPSIYTIHELLEIMKRMVLHHQSCEVAMTQGNKISKRSPGEDPLLTV